MPVVGKQDMTWLPESSSHCSSATVTSAESAIICRGVTLRRLLGVAVALGQLISRREGEGDMIDDDERMRERTNRTNSHAGNWTPGTYIM